MKVPIISDFIVYILILILQPVRQSINQPSAHEDNLDMLASSWNIFL
jgi:hypothetical protein